MANRRELLLPGVYYHVYNRANAEDRLFTEDVEYYIFLRKYFTYSSMVFSTYGFCLLSNHFHFLIRVHSEDELTKRIGVFKDDKSRSNYIAQHLGNFFNWYATYFNKKYDRKGSLFLHTFNRKPILDQAYLTSLVCYIHANPVKAGLCDKPENWKYSSYKEFVHTAKNLPVKNKNEVLNWFDGKENFIDTHLMYLGEG